MSVRFDAIGDYLRRDFPLSLPSIAKFTMMGWFKLAVNRATYSTFMAVGNPSGSAYFQVAAGADGVTLGSYNGNGSSFTNGTTALTVGRWYHVAFTVEGTGTGQFKIYLDGVLNIINDGNAAPSILQLWIGNSADDDWMNGSAAGIKIWDGVALTPLEIAHEAKCIWPIRARNLFDYWPLFGHNAVMGYRGRQDWTIGGTLASEENPGVPRSLYRKTLGMVPASGGGGGGSPAAGFRSLLGVGR